VNGYRLDDWGSIPGKDSSSSELGEEILILEKGSVKEWNSKFCLKDLQFTLLCQNRVLIKK